LHVIVLEGESIKKRFPDLLRAQLLSCGVRVEDSDGVRELRPKRSKTLIHRVFEQVTFMLVQGHLDGLRSVVDGEVSSGDELTSEVTTRLNPAVFNADGLEEAPDVVRNILRALDPAVDEQGWGRKIPSDPGSRRVEVFTAGFRVVVERANHHGQQGGWSHGRSRVQQGWSHSRHWTYRVEVLGGQRQQSFW
jgi:plasmid stabilization system protein ParE